MLLLNGGCTLSRGSRDTAMLHHRVLSFRRHHRRVRSRRLVVIAAIRRVTSDALGISFPYRGGQQFAHGELYPAIFFCALAPQSRLQLQLSNDAILYESECAVLGPPPISMADYFSVSRALLSRRGEADGAYRPLRTPARIVRG